MATISQSLRVTWANGDGDSVTAAVTQRFTPTGNAAYANVQTIGASSEAIVVGEVSGDCLIFFKNQNPEYSELSDDDQADYTSEADYNTKNTVYVGTVNPATSSSANTHHIKPGAGALVTGTLASHYAIRDTDDVDLLVVIFEK